jgi:hypothetical protein
MTPFVMFLIIFPLFDVEGVVYGLRSLQVNGFDMHDRGWMLLCVFNVDPEGGCILYIIISMI